MVHNYNYVCIVEPFIDCLIPSPFSKHTCLADVFFLLDIASETEACRTVAGSKETVDMQCVAFHRSVQTRCISYEI